MGLYIYIYNSHNIWGSMVVICRVFIVGNMGLYKVA